MNASDVFEVQSPFAGTMPDYEYRHGQRRMAQVVQDVLAYHGVAFVEAGTGTGKTLAYLVPAILSGKKVVISTGTKALQDQIVHRELPRIEHALDLQANALSIKGLSNYLCLRRFREYRLSNPADSLVESVTRWSDMTHTGAHDELYDIAEDAPIFSAITASAETRVGPKCDFYERCFVTRLKTAAQAAQLIIVNHHLFFANLSMESNQAGRVLPSYDAVIFDEAHQIEDVMTEYFGVKVSTERIDALCRDIQDAFAHSPIRAEVELLLQAALRRGHQLGGLVGQASASKPGRTLIDTTRSSVRWREWHSQIENDLDRLENYMEESATIRGAMALLMRRVRGVRNDLATIIAARHNSHVVWGDASRDGGTIGASPIDVGSIFRARVLDVTKSVVCTSATLSASDSFEFAKGRLGVDREVDEYIVPSTFDYKRQATLYVANHLPDCRTPQFLEMAAMEIEKLINLSQGGVFILCTSLNAMHQLASLYAPVAKYEVLVQKSAPKDALLQRFRADGNAVLFGSGTFWHGVDVPGSALRMVIIDRLPFDVPTDPMVTARCKALQEEGKDPFRHYQLPMAALTLKQGFGRLIRNQNDYGVVAVLDRRLISKGYGKMLLRSLPDTPCVSDWEQLRVDWHRLARSAGHAWIEIPVSEKPEVG